MPADTPFLGTRRPVDDDLRHSAPTALTSGKQRLGDVSPWRPAFVLLVGLIGLTFMLGGGARDDIASLVVLRPLAAIIAVIAVGLAGHATWRRHRVLMSFSGLVIGLALLQLVPLPPSIWTAFPGRDFVVAGYADVGTRLPWLPVSLTPGATWNAAFAMAGPLAALILALSVSPRARQMLAPILLLVGVISGLIGLLQAIGPADGILFPYRITNFGSAVGLFANRNHHGLFLLCMWPILAAFGTSVAARHHPRSTLLGTVLIGMFLLAMIFVNGSRGALLLVAPALLLTLWTLRPSLRGLFGDFRPRWLVPTALAHTAALLLGLAAIVWSRNASLDRLLSTDVAEDLRFQALPTIWTAVADFFPVGSGIGSFENIYKLFEPHALLRPEYLNHAHNDIAEVLLTSGLAGLLLMIFGLVLLGTAAVRLARRDAAPDHGTNILGRAGVSVLAILVAGSTFDYPLRVPSLAILAAIAAAWAIGGHKVSAAGRVATTQSRPRAAPGDQL